MSSQPLIKSPTTESLDEAQYVTLHDPHPLDVAGRFSQAGLPHLSDLGLDANVSNSPEGQKQLTAETEQLINIPAERLSHISFGFEGERWRLRNLISLIGLSATGLLLIDQTYQAGYRICFDGMATPHRTMDTSMNVMDKVILLDPRAQAADQIMDLILMLGLANAALGGVYFDYLMMPTAALHAQRLALAYARALQIQVCFELQTVPTMAGLPPNESYWAKLNQCCPLETEAFHSAAMNELALNHGSAMANAIRTFYNTPANLQQSDCDVINYYRALPPLLYKDAKNMTVGFESQTLAYKLPFPSVVYAITRDPKLNLTDPLYNRATQEIVQAISELQQMRRTAGIKDRDTWQISVAQN